MIDFNSQNLSQKEYGNGCLANSQNNSKDHGESWHKNDRTSRIDVVLSF